VRELTIEGSSDEFTIERDTCAGSTLEPGSQCEAALAFAPSEEGARAAVLAFATDEGVWTFNLDGDGVTSVKSRTGGA
jgi:hypothetical protein